MTKYIFKKFLKLIFVLIGISVISFIITFFVPGNPAEIILSQSGIEPTKIEILKLEKEMGLDKPVHIQYINWLSNVLKGDLGTSYVSRNTVISEITYRILPTLKLTLSAFTLMILLSVPIGIISALNQNKLIDNVFKIFSFIFMSVPSFFLGSVFIYYFSVRLKIFPVAGNDTIRHIVLPSIVLALPMACKYIRLIRISFIEVLEEEYIYALRARGLKEQTIVIKNAIKNAFIPIITSFAMSLGSLLGGSVIVENIFAWPGLGNYLVYSIMNRDFPVVQGYILLMAFIFVLINFIADIICKFLDPKISLEGSE